MDFNADCTSLAIKARDGNVRAFTKLCRIICREKYAFAKRLVKTSAEAEQLLQEAYFQAWSALQYLEKPERFSEWFDAVIIYTALDRIMKKDPDRREAQDEGEY